MIRVYLRLVDEDTRHEASAEIDGVLSGTDPRAALSNPGDRALIGGMVASWASDPNTPSTDTAAEEAEPVVWMVTAVPEGANTEMTGQRYSFRRGLWRWCNGGVWDYSMWPSLGAMAAAGYRLEAVDSAGEANT